MTHEWTETSANIRVRGLSRTIRVLHVTDSHISLIDERDGQHLEKCRDARGKFASRRLDASGAPVSTEVTFAETLTRSDFGALDLLALTGDIVNFPAQASLESASASLARAGMPALYTPGNHDWLFSGLEGTDARRLEFYPALAPLHGGAPSFAKRDIHGVRFIAIDDSNYQVNDEQFEFAHAALKDGMPSVFLIHIPISLPTLRPPTIARWNAPILLGDPHWDELSRKKWFARVNGDRTVEFVRLLAESAHVIAVLCGHIHFHHADNLNPHAIQYVGKPGYEGGYRLIEIGPL